MPSLSRIVVSHRGTVLAAWTALVAFAVPCALGVGERLDVAGEVPGGEATTVQSRLSVDFARDDERLLALVVSGITGSNPMQSPGASIAAALEELDWVRAVDIRQVDAPGDLVIFVSLTDALTDSAALASLRAVTAEVLAREPSAAGAQASWTGEIAVREDIIEASTDDLRSAEVRALPLSFLILWLVFGAITAAVLPLAIGLISMLLTLAFAWVLADAIAISVMVQSVASLLGLALGIDYALLMISQFRKELVAAADARTAAVRALDNCGKTVLVSGAAVSIGFAGLTLVPVENLRSIGIAGMAVAAFAALLTTTALPSLLSWLGDRIDRGRLWPRPGVEASALWYRWSTFVCDHPWCVAIAGAVPLIALGLLARDMETAFPADSWLPQDAESIAALERLQALGEAGAINRLIVLYELPEGADARRSPGGTALRRLHVALISDERTESVRSGASFNVGRGGLFRAPASVVDAYVSPDGRTALLELVPRADLDTGHELTTFVRDIRKLDIGTLTGLGGRIAVGGTPAATVDYEDLVAYWFPRVIVLVALGSLLVLAVSFRSLVIPLKAVVLNLLAVIAAYGVITLIFVHGFGVGLFGLAAPVEGVFPPTPMIVFCAAFGISMDYEVFLLSGIAGARRRGLDDRASIIEGIARTGRVITSAAAIMVVVFGAFAFGEVLPTQILGTGLAVVVAIDALLIRVALGPAVVRLAGRWNWWPGS